MKKHKCLCTYGLQGLLLYLLLVSIFLQEIQDEREPRAGHVALGVPDGPDDRIHDHPLLLLRHPQDRGKALLSDHQQQIEES